MSEHREGTLFYDTETGRYDIRFDLESFYGGLHCGECFDVKVKNVWVPVRIEMGDDWYLVGLNVSRLFSHSSFPLYFSTNIIPCSASKDCLKSRIASDQHFLCPGNNKHTIFCKNFSSLSGFHCIKRFSSS